MLIPSQCRRSRLAPVEVTLDAVHHWDSIKYKREFGTALSTPTVTNIFQHLRVKGPVEPSDFQSFHMSKFSTRAHQQKLNHCCTFNDQRSTPLQWITNPPCLVLKR